MCPCVKSSSHVESRTTRELHGTTSISETCVIQEGEGEVSSLRRHEQKHTGNHNNLRRANLIHVYMPAIMVAISHNIRLASCLTIPSRAVISHYTLDISGASSNLKGLQFDYSGVAFVVRIVTWCRECDVRPRKTCQSEPFKLALPRLP